MLKTTAFYYQSARVTAVNNTITEDIAALKHAASGVFGFCRYNRKLVRFLVSVDVFNLIVSAAKTKICLNADPLISLKNNNYDLVYLVVIHKYSTLNLMMLVQAFIKQVGLIFELTSILPQYSATEKL